ncbi:MAG: methionyl-tRNA formyltransferase [Candidatus Marinimicrobia bacterium]|jgi:methionyl-tRNA formyltransferase|nr:methionyl-tRNA formyltransferase [Candidatus Neomarinimicrobiota bacterium]
MKIIFMGTPDFAVPTLDKLFNSKYQISAVVTATDKASGRGQKVKYSAVKKYALKNNIPILQPNSLSSEQFKNDLINLKADIYIVVAFRILPKKIFSIPQYGSINAHASILPKYRGPAPIHWAIYNGETETGVTTFKIDKKVDTGTILLQNKIPILQKDNVGTMYEKLKYLAADSIIETIENIDNLKPILQNEKLASKAPKIKTEMGKLNFHKNGKQIIDQIRAFTPSPGTYIFLGGTRLKIIEAEFVSESNTKSGEIKNIDKKQFGIECKDGLILPIVVQSAGKRKMSVVDFMNGFDISQFARIDDE